MEDRLNRLIKEYLKNPKSKKPCSCGCGTCGEGEGPKLNESFKGKLTTTEVFKVHMDKSIPLTESKYPKNSKEYKNLIIEARYLYSRKVIDLNKKDTELIKELKTNDGFPVEQIIKFQGLNIVVENKKGTTRSGIDPDGNAWEIEMKFPYGYVRRTEGVDGDEVDVYVGDNRESDKVFVVHQNVPETGEFDEDKVMLGFDSGEEAKSAYLDHYDNPKFFGSMTEMSFTEFKEKLKKNKGQQLYESIEVGNMINIARAKAYFKLGEKIVAQNKKQKK